MNKKRGTIGKVVDEILLEKGISVDQLCKKTGFKRSTVFSLMQQEVAAEDLKLRFIKGLAHVTRTSIADIYLKFGIDVNATPSRTLPFRPENSHLPLTAKVMENSQLERAIKVAVRAKSAWRNGMMNDTLSDLWSALRYSENADVPVVPTYFKTHLINVAEMSGHLDQSEIFFAETQNDITQLRSVARKAKDDNLINIADQLDLQSRVYNLWTTRWARGVSEASITEGELLRALIEKKRLHFLLPCLYIYLGRCSLALGYDEQALHYMERGRIQAYALPHDHLVTPPLFLDVGGNIQRVSKDYRWQADFVLAATVDILIALGRVSEAFEVYLQIRSHRRPCAQWSFFNWPNLGWQKLLRNQTVVTVDNDVKLDFSEQEWEADLEEGGHIYIQGLNLYAQGEAYEAKGDLFYAETRFKAVLERIRDKGMEDLFVRAAIAVSRVATKRGKRPVAVEHLSMIEERVHKIANPVIRREYHKIQEAIGLI